MAIPDSETPLLRSVALQNAKSILLARERAEEELIQTKDALREETRILELLNETGKALAAELDLEVLIQTCTDAATQLSGADFGAFFHQRPEHGDRFQLLTLSGATRKAFEEFGAAWATSLFGPGFSGEGPTRCEDVLNEVRYARLPSQFGLPTGVLPLRSCLAVPVRSRSGVVVGGLLFGHRKPGAFSDRVERLMVGVAAQAGIAIDNARLYEAAQASAQERQTLLESERAARSAAERLSELKDEFLATLSHELRTPLNAILGWAQVLQNASRTESDLREGLEAIERNARVQTQLIEDLLDMSRITSGKLRLDVQPLHLAPILEAAVQTVKPSADAKDIRIECVLDPAAGPVSGDPGRLQQVVWNLLSNAIKFTPKHGKVQVRLERVNSQVEISVADTGVGINAEFIPHLFERFRQANASTTRTFGGLGLGLSIVKRLIELHGGDVRVVSDGEDQGTTVTVALPLTVVRWQDGATSREHPRTSALGTRATVGADDLAGLTVLVVDDQIDARTLIRRVLEDCGAKVMTCATADEALALLKQHRPDVLLTDIGMPGTDGYELIRRVRAIPAEQGGRIPAIALTAFARSEDRTRALRAGFMVHVSKPVDPSELIATVASVAGRV